MSKAMPAKSGGFSLLELIGVLAVMGIMAGALAPSVFQLIEDGYADAEIVNLSTIGDTLRDYVRREKTIPTASGDAWAIDIAAYASMTPQRVLRNQKRYKRRYFVDRRFFENTSQAFAGYVQERGLSARPYSPRIIIASSLDGEINQTLDTPAKFDAVWSGDEDATIVESKKVKIERINLAPLFVRVVLNNANDNQAGYALEGGADNAIAAASGGADGSRTLYLIADTRLALKAAPFPSGDLQRQIIVTEETSLRYELAGVAWHWDG